MKRSVLESREEEWVNGRDADQSVQGCNVQMNKF